MRHIQYIYRAQENNDHTQRRVKSEWGRLLVLVSKRACLAQLRAAVPNVTINERLWSQSASAHYMTNDCDVFGFKELCGAPFRRKKAILPKTAHAQNEYSWMWRRRQTHSGFHRHYTHVPKIPDFTKKVKVSWMCFIILNNLYTAHHNSLGIMSSDQNPYFFFVWCDHSTLQSCIPSGFSWCSTQQN